MVMSTIIVTTNVSNDRYSRVDRQSSDVALSDYITSIDVVRRYLAIPISMIYFRQLVTGKYRRFFVGRKWR